jgi:hypothetical protein
MSETITMMRLEPAKSGAARKAGTAPYPAGEKVKKLKEIS